MTKKIVRIALITFILALLLAFSTFAYEVDLRGRVSGLQDGISYTVSKYDITTDTFGTYMPLTSETQLEAGVWNIKAGDSEPEQLFVDGAQMGQFSFWNTQTEAVESNIFGGYSDTFKPGKWTINKAGVYTNVVESSMKSETVPTVCIYFDKTKVVTPVEGGTGYENATPISGESNLLQESSFSYGFTQAQIVPANRVVSCTFPMVVVRTGGMKYTNGYSLEDAKGLFTFTVKVPGVKEYETYSVETNVEEYGELTVVAPEEMKASNGYVVAITYAPYANCPDEIYSGNWDTNSRSYVHIGMNKGENKLKVTPSTYPAPTVYDGFGIIGVDPNRTYEIAEARIKSNGTGLEFGEWTEYTHSASRNRDLVGLYAVRESYDGKVSNYSIAYAYGDNTERQNILDLNEAGTHIMNCCHLSSYDRALFYHGMWSGDVCNSTGLGKYTLFNHSQVSLTAYNTAKTALDNATEDTLAAAKEAFDKAAENLSKNVNNIKYKYAFDREGVIRTDEATSLKLSLRCDNSTLVTDKLTTMVVAYVADRNGEVKTYEAKYTQNYAKSFSCTVNFADFLPEEGWMVAFEIYPNTDTTPDSFIEVDTGGFRYPLTLSTTTYTISTPDELPSTDVKPEGLSYESGAIKGLSKAFAYEYAQFDINGIEASAWKYVPAGASEFDPEMTGLVAVKLSGDGYSHNGSDHTYVYIPGNSLTSILHTTPTLNKAGTATLDVVDVVNAGSYADAGGKIKFNQAKWTGLTLSNSLALSYGFDALILGSSSTPISGSWATAIRDASNENALATARANAAKVSDSIYYSYAYTPDEIIPMSDFESFKFRVSLRQGCFTLNGTVQTKFVFKVIDENDELVDRIAYKDVSYTKTGTNVTVNLEDFDNTTGYIVGIVIHPYVLTDGSYFDCEDSDNGDYNVYLIKNGYSVDAIMPAEKPVLSMSTKNAVITVDNYNEKLTYAYSFDGEEWTSFKGASFTAVKAAADYTVKALGNSEYLESPVSEPITSPEITVVGTSLVLDGTIGIKVYMDIDTNSVSDVNFYMTRVNEDYKCTSDDPDYNLYRQGGASDFSTGTAWSTPVTLDSETGLYSMTVSIPAKDVDNVRIECDLGGYLKNDSSRVSYSNLGGTLTFADYVERSKALASEGDEKFINALDLISQLENYVAYADNYFNGGDLEKYTTAASTDLIESASRTDAKLDGVEFYGTSLILKDNVTIRHYFAVSDISAFNSKYTCDISYGEKEGYIYYDITDIPAQHIGTQYTLTIKDEEGTAYEIEYSAANYLKTAMNSHNTRLASLANAMFGYYASADAYVNPKPLYVKYDTGFSIEGAQNGIHLYIPTENGYIDHTYVHTVSDATARNSDVWRLSVAYMCDDELKNPVAITTPNAEWDMALMLSGRGDFIGGWAHGDELMTDVKFYVDGVETDVTTLTKATEFKKLEIIENSIGYDPSNNTTAVLKHHKEYTVTHAGIRLEQKVEWLGEYQLSHSYLAMMPPTKTYTDAFYTTLTEPADLNLSEHGTYYVDGTTSVTVYGKESGLYFTMTVNDYDTFIKPYMSIADNGGGSYNKMYFTFVKNGTVLKGDVWETFTHYKIDRKNV